MIRILIADDHPIVRRGIRQILEEHPDLVVAGEAQHSQELLQLIGQQEWDVLLLDLNMPGMSGLEMLSEVKKKCPRLPVLVLSVHPEEQFAVRILKAGAAGYMNKESAPEDLVKAIRKVHAGGRYVSSSLAEKLALALAHGAELAPHEILTDREYQVMCLIASGKTVSEIAEELCLSVKTISTFRTRLLDKMRMRSNAEVTTYAIRNRLVE